MSSLRMEGEAEVYNRIIDLAKKVVKGEVDPLDLDLSNLVKMFSSVDVNRLPYELFLKDVEALNGLSLILYYQKDSLRKILEGLKIDAIYVKTLLLSMSIDELEKIFMDMYRPPIDLSSMGNHFIIDSLIYFKNIRRLRLDLERVPVNIREVEIHVEEDIRKEMFKLYEYLRDRYGYEEVEYGEVIRDDPPFKAYLISILASEGYIGIRHDRVNDVIYIRLFEKPRRPKNPVSLPIVVSRYGDR